MAHNDCSYCGYQCHNALGEPSCPSAKQARAKATPPAAKGILETREGQKAWLAKLLMRLVLTAGNEDTDGVKLDEQDLTLPYIDQGLTDFGLVAEGVMDSFFATVFSPELTTRAEAALSALLRRDQRNTCMHDETHRGGAIWEICDQCGARWADDKGGRPEWKDPPEWVEAEAVLSALRTGHQSPQVSQEPIKPPATNPNLLAALNAAAERYALATPEERQAMNELQRESWVRGEMAMNETVAAKHFEDCGFRYSPVLGDDFQTGGRHAQETIRFTDPNITGEASSMDTAAILDDRHPKYGSFDTNAMMAQALKNTLRRGPSWERMPPAQREALDLIATKLARIANGDPSYADSWVDIGGYALLGQKAAEAGGQTG